jgi:hypothetical protein
MRKLGILISVYVFFAACNKPIQLTKEQEEFGSEFKKELKIPLILDSSFIAGLDTIESLELKFIQQLTKDSMDSQLGGGLKNSLNGCIFIERLKENGRFKNYSDSIDTGMLKNAMAFKIGKVTLNNKMDLFLWGINEASYEADPGYSGISIIASCANKNKGFTHILVAERYAAGDPPLFMEKKTNGEILKNEIKINTVTSTQDKEIGSNLKEGTFLKLELDNGEVKILQKTSTK